MFPSLDEQAERNIAGVREFAEKRGLLFEGTAYSWAVFSPDRVYRYLLGRQWHPDGAIARWIMLNPSSAGASGEDPTSRKVRGFSNRVAGSYVIANLGALVSTDPRGLVNHPDPIGLHNDAALGMLLSAPVGPLVAAWGRFPSMKISNRFAVNALRVRCTRPLCYGLTKDGEPRHPLMLAYSTPRVRMSDGGLV